MTETDRARFEVLLEDIQTKIDVIAEGHLGLAERIDGVDRHLHTFEQRVDRRFDALAVDVGVLKVDVGVLKTDVADVKVRVGRIEERPDLGGGTRGRAPRRAARR